MPGYWIVALLWACGILPFVIAECVDHLYGVAKAIFAVLWVVVAVTAIGFWNYAGSVNPEYTNHWYWWWIPILSVLFFACSLDDWERPIKVVEDTKRKTISREGSIDEMG